MVKKIGSICSRSGCLDCSVLFFFAVLSQRRFASRVQLNKFAHTGLYVLYAEGRRLLKWCASQSTNNCYQDQYI